MVDKEPANVAAWKRFLEFCEQQMSSQQIYRGVESSAYKLVPGIGRPPGRYAPTKERNILDLFEKRAHLYVNLMHFSALDRLVLAQHHGLPTRLLDWTTSPLVAAFFATRQRKENDDADATIYSIRPRGRDYVSSADDPFSLEEVKFYLPRFVSPRIAAQGGIFSLHPEPKKSWESKDVIKFVIPSQAKAHFRRRLHLFGINAMKLFPDLDGLASTLDWQYRSGIELWHVSQQEE